MAGKRILGSLGLPLFVMVACAVTAGPVLADPYNPCDSVAALPQCDAAVGPLRDVTAAWRDYQPALAQPVPISDYQADPEDGPPPAGVGTCGGETVNQPPTGPQIPAATQVQALPAGVPPVPGKNSPYGAPYCLLRFIAGDFDPLCAGCHRVLLDFSAIPAGNATSPAADGHWAMRITPGQNTQATSPPNGHSPNIKNLCSDKFVNPGPGATCPYAQYIDMYAIEVEGDSTIYHHFPFEGRYYNGPAYLAGDGAGVPYHWIHGAYVDIDLHSVLAGDVYYGAGYRGLGDAAPDTDQSYGCLCEVPPVGHSTMSVSYALAALAAPSPAPPPASAAAPSPSPSPRLPNTAIAPSARGGPLGPLAVALLLGLVVAIAPWMRRRHR